MRRARRHRLDRRGPAGRDGRGAVRREGRDDPDARRGASSTRRSSRRRAAPDRCRSSCSARRTASRRRRRGLRRLLQGARRRRLHLRLPGHPRQVRLRGRRSSCSGRRARPATRRRSTRAPTPTTRSTGCSRTCRATTAASACSASPTTAGRRSWARSSRIPALKAISPQASPADMWLGDDFHHNGAFRLSYGFEYALLSSRAAKDVQAVRASTATTPTTGTSRSGSLANVNAQLPPREDPDLERLRRAPGLRRVLEAPDADPAPRRGHGADAERRRLVGPGGLLRPARRSTRRSRSTTPKNLNYLVVGPWNHGGWARGDGRPARARSRSAARPAKYFRDEVAGAVVRATT